MVVEKKIDMIRVVKSGKNTIGPRFVLQGYSVESVYSYDEYAIIMSFFSGTLSYIFSHPFTTFITFIRALVLTVLERPHNVKTRWKQRKQGKQG